MIVEIVTFTFPTGHDRESELEAVRGVVGKWAANQDLVRKHFLWASARPKAPAPASISGPRSRPRKRAHDDEWREGREEAHRRLSDDPLFRSCMALVDNKQRHHHRVGGRAESARGNSDARVESDRSCMSDIRLAVDRFHPASRRAGQTIRNAMQRELTATLGTAGATHVRFLFGFPFAVLFLLGLMADHRRLAAVAAVRILAVGGARHGRADRSPPR